MPTAPHTTRASAASDPGPTWEAYCGECNDDVLFEQREVAHDLDIRGTPIHVDVPGYVCPTCGHIRSHPQHDPLEAAYHRYREFHRLLQPDYIKGMREHYGLSQEAFAHLLGVSPATIARYEGGSLQDEAHDHLLKACQSPEFMRNLMKEHGDRLSPLQRRRFEDAVAEQPQPIQAQLWIETARISERYTGNRAFDYGRAAFMVRGLCDIAGRTFSTKLNKLCFYTDFLAFKAFGQSISGCPYQRIQMGPVPHQYRSLLDRLVEDGFVLAQEIDFVDADGTECSGTAFTAGDPVEIDGDLTPSLNVIAHVAKTFHHTPRPEIVDRSHKEDAWVKTAPKKLISYEHAATLSLSLEG